MCVKAYKACGIKNEKKKKNQKLSMSRKYIDSENPHCF